MTVYDTASSGVVSRRIADAVGAKSAAFVPLLVEERVTAVISVATLDQPRVFSSDELAVMQTLASEAAVALERLRAEVALEEALQRNEEQLAQQTALLRAAHVLSSELDLPVVLQRLADQLAQLLDADAADCYLLDDERGVFRCVAVHGFDSSVLSFEFPMGQGLAGAAVREGRPLIESAYGEIPDPVPHPAYDGFTDVITAPMFWSDEVRGVLGVGRREGRRFTDRDAGHPRGLRGPRLARVAERGDVHAERAAGADPAGLLPDRLGARAVAVSSRDARGGRPGCRRGARRQLVCGARPLERAARGGRGVRASRGPARDPRRARLGPAEPALARCRRGPHHRLLFDRGRRPAAARPPRCRRGEPLPLAHLRAGGRAARRGPGSRPDLLRGGALVQRRRPRARAPPCRRDARRARAQRAVRGRARRPARSRSS